MGPHYFTKMFKPHSVAVFNASAQANTAGAVVIRNLVQGQFKGPVYAIDINQKVVQGLNTYGSLKEVGNQVDLAIITTPANTVPGIIKECGRLGTRTAIILSTDFGVLSDTAKHLEEHVIEAAHQCGVRFLGPNSLGVIRTDIDLNATFSKCNAHRGKLALVSQSGALCTAILDWAQASGVGFSSVISTGIAADVDFGEILDFLISDPQTESILLYIEFIRDARSFMSALRAAARVKPVIVMKTGRYGSGSRATLSHTGALVGADHVFDAALKRAGAVRVFDFSDLFAAAKSLSSHLRTQGEHLAIVTNGSGPGIMASDRLVDLGLEPAQLSEATVRALSQALPATWSHTNPIDINGDASAERYRAALDICLAAPEIDAVMAILTPQAMTCPEDVAATVAEVQEKINKPLITCWMGHTQIKSSRALIGAHNVPSLRTPEAAVDAFNYLYAYHRNQQLLLEVPEPISKELKPDVEGARMIVEGAFADQRRVLSEMESKALLSAFHIPVTKGVSVRSPAEALIFAEEIGFPVALKVDSPDIIHKSVVDGVKLNIANARDLYAAYDELMGNVKKLCPEATINGVIVEEMFVCPRGRELMIGVVYDAVFGPVICFGMGGVAVEALADQAIALPPLNQYLVQDLIRSTKVSKLLSAFRNLPPVDSEALENVLLRVSEMVCELPAVKTMDINPVIIDDTGLIAVDARVMVERRPPTERGYDHMAIHPYPTRLVSAYQLANGAKIEIRPIRPEDAVIERRFVRSLSDRSKYFRFMYALPELTPEMLSRMTQIDYDREMALIAVTKCDGENRQIGVARYMINPDGESCEFAVVVSDDWQGKGIATKLMSHLIDSARDKQFKSMVGEVLQDNWRMLNLMQNFGFKTRRNQEDPHIVSVTRSL